MLTPVLLDLQANGVHQVEAVFLLLLVFVLLFVLVADRLRIPYPIVLVMAGLALGFVPGMPHITLAPDLVFLVILPPLLFAAAWVTSWRDFKRNFISIMMLAFGLVGFTVAGVAVAAPHVLPGFDWRLGFLLGAVVATTDAVAAVSVAHQVGLPRRILDVLEGESLLNDASGLLALEFGLAIFVRGETPSVASGLLRLIWLTVGGLATGLFIGFIVDRFERRVEHNSLEIVLSILVPYATYLSAETIHASGVIAVVAAGLFLGRRSAEFFSPQARLQGTAVWDALTFAFNGLTFILIGLQLPTVWAGIADYSPTALLVSGVVFSCLLILLRMVWTFPGAWLAITIRRKLLHEDVPWPGFRPIFIVGWTGMRGVIALGAALSLPAVLSNGQPFPERNFILFLTFIVILVTLVFQGLTLPFLIRFLGLANLGESNAEELEAREAILQLALTRIEELRAAERSYPALFEDLTLHYNRRLQALSAKQSNDQQSDSPALEARYREVSKELLVLERGEALRLRDTGAISDEVLRRLLHELDLAETKWQVST